MLAGDTDFEDEYSRALKREARENGVILTGFVKGKKLHSLLTNARCYVLPSSHEGLPIALLEAMSYRLPVIVSDIPANKEMGLDASCYFETGNIEQLADRLQEIIDGDFKQVHYDMEKYGWDGIALRVADVYENLKNENTFIGRADGASVVSVYFESPVCVWNDRFASHADRGDAA